MSGAHENGDLRKLLEIKEVVDEINRHLWIESEKAGYDIGFEKASDDWLHKYAKAWMQYHRPELLKKGRAKKTTASKTRRAGSYEKRA